MSHLLDLFAVLDGWKDDNFPEGIALNPDEMKAVREFHSEIAGLSPDEVRTHLSETNRKQGVC